MDFPKIAPLPLLQPNRLNEAVGREDQTASTTGGQSVSFLQYLNQALDSVNAAQAEADQAAQALAAGQIQDLSQVTIAAEKATLMLQMTVQVRNKVIEAYQEIMRTQL